MAQFHVLTPADDRLTALPVVRRISLSDLSESLRQGWEDFKVWPTHAVFLCIIYPIVGLVLGGIALTGGSGSVLGVVATSVILIMFNPILTAVGVNANSAGLFTGVSGVPSPLAPE